MAKVAITESYLEDIADAIREKTGLSEETYTPSEMAPAIATISGSGGITPTGTINITENGTYNVTHYANANISVPNSYSSSDEGKVVSNGALVSQSGTTYTENGTYDTTLKNSVIVDVEGSGGSGVIITDTRDVHGSIIREITTDSIARLIPKRVVENGVYNASDDNADGYNSVTVDVDGWIRPDDWPDLSVLDITGEVMYLTYIASEAQGFTCFTCKTSEGQYKVEIGDIINDQYVAETSYYINTNTACSHYFGNPNSAYKVLRITAVSGHLTEFNNYTQTSNLNVDSENRYRPSSGLLEIYGNTPYITSFSIRNNNYIQCLNIKNIQPISLDYCIFQCHSLVYIDASTWDLSNCTKLSSAIRQCGRLKCIEGHENWNVEKVTTCDSAFQGNSCLLKFDTSSWNAIRCTTFNNFLSGAYSLVDVNVKNLVKSSCTIASNLLYMARQVKTIDISGWNTTGLTNTTGTFREMYSLQEINYGNVNFSNVNTSQYMYASNYSIYSLVIPDISVIQTGFVSDLRSTKEFHFKSTTPPTLAASSGIFPNMNEGGGRTIYVPYSSDHSILNAYKTASNWSALANYIEEESQ